MNKYLLICSTISNIVNACSVDDGDGTISQDDGVEDSDVRPPKSNSFYMS